MKKFLALTLVLCTLLCLFPVAASAEVTKNEMKNETGSYLDLYVKEGLVALYDAYSGVAADAFEGTAKWAPVDFYEKEGYNDYADLSVSTADLMAGVNMRWKWENGYLVKSSSTDTPSTGGDGHRDDNFSFIRLNTLGEQLLADANAQLTVQQVYQLLGGITKDIYLSTPKVENGVVVNASTITAYPYTYSGGFKIGDLDSSYDYHTWVHDGKLTQGGVWRAKFTGDTLGGNSAYFLGEYYNVLQGADTSNASRWVRMGETGIVYETVTRTESTKYNVSFRNALTTYSGASSAEFPCTIASAAGSTEISLQRGIRARVFSIRIYNTVLTEEQNKQNYLADLLGFYGVDAAPVLSLSAEELAIFANATASFDIAKDASEFEAGKKQLQDAINSMDDIIAEPMRAQLRPALYVKDGLVAMFDGNNSTATAGKLTALTPADFFGKEGYTDYVDPSLYTADIVGGTWDVLEWYYENGSIAVKYNGNYGDRSANSNYFECVDLSDLAAIIGNTYTVQETFTYAHPEGAPTVSDGVVTYTPKITNDGFRFDGKHVFGPLSMSTTYMKQPAAGSNGVAGGYSFPYVALNTGGAYRGHHLYAGEAYGAPEYANLGYVGGDDITMERSVIRNGYVKEEDNTFTSSFAIYYAKEPLYRTGNYLWVDDMEAFTYNSDNETEHKDSTLHIMANTGAYYYSVRIYNKALSEAELAQNHFADLVNYYKVDPTAITLLSAEGLAALAEATADISIVRADKEDAAYVENLTALEAAIGDAVGAIENVLDAAADNAISFGGVAYRTSGNFGVRALFAIDSDAIATLASYGFTVTYGAIVGVGTNGGNVVNESAEALRVGVDSNGDVVLVGGKGKLIASDDASFKHLTEDNVSYAATITFSEDGSNSALYGATLLYRGFAVIRNANGEIITTIYDDAAVAGLDSGISLISVHEKALADTTGMSAELIARLESVLP